MFRNNEGFTLLELLVAVAIVALMAVPVTESLQKAIHAWKLSHSRADESEERLLMQQRIAKWISSAYSVDPRITTVPPLVGEHDRLTFIGAIHPDDRSDGFYKVTLSLNTNRELVVSAKPDTATGGDAFVETPLIKAINALEFSYLASAAGQPANWVETWQGQHELPRGVRLSIDFADSSIFWPDLIIPLIVKEWEHSAYVPISRSGGG